MRALIAVSCCMFACGSEFQPIDRIATQNVGTTMFLDTRDPTPLRLDCSNWYDNNLCHADAEQVVGSVITRQTPDVLFLQEVWDSELCSDPARPDEVDLPPFVCASTGRQQDRLLPDGYRYACSRGYPDNCIAFREEVFTPDGPCAGTDCSALIEDLDTSCSEPGRIALLKGTSDLGPTTLIVVHAQAGQSPDNMNCRTEQFSGLRTRLRTETGVLIIGGDFNVDPVRDMGPDVTLIAELRTEHSLTRLLHPGTTHRLLENDLDLVFVRNIAEGATCEVIFPDEILPNLWFDHGFVSCR